MVLLLLISGCASLEGLPGPEGRPEILLKGRVAVRYGNEGGSASINWRHGRQFDDMLVASSLGQGIARITRVEESFVLTTVDGREYRAADAESLTETVLGWRLPLAGLPDWVRGQAVAGQPSRVRRDESGQLQRIEQDAWQIDYLLWNGALPARMTLHRDAQAGRDAIDIRLIIDELSVTN